jgi:hypothetical protein
MSVCPFEEEIVIDALIAIHATWELRFCLSRHFISEEIKA